MIPVQDQSFKWWLLQLIQSTEVDSDADTMLQYVLALLGTSQSDDEIRSNCIEELEVFLGEATTQFVDKIFQHLREQDYSVGVAAGEDDEELVYEDYPDEEEIPDVPIASVVTQPGKRRRSEHAKMEDTEEITYRADEDMDDRRSGEVQKRARQSSPTMTFVVKTNSQDEDSDDDGYGARRHRKDDSRRGSRRDYGENDLSEQLQSRVKPRSYNRNGGESPNGPVDLRNLLQSRGGGNRMLDRNVDQGYNPDFAAMLPQNRRESNVLTITQGYEPTMKDMHMRPHFDNFDNGFGRGRRAPYPNGPPRPGFRPPHPMDMRGGMRDGRGGGRGGSPRPGWGGRPPFQQPQERQRMFDLRYLANTLLEVKNIAPEQNNMESLNAYFKQFGTIARMEPCIEGDPSRAIVEYKLNSEAKAAFNSDALVMDSSFTKVYFVSCSLQPPKDEQTMITQMGGVEAYEQAKKQYIEEYRERNNGEDPPAHFLSGGRKNKQYKNGEEWVDRQYTEEEIQKYEEEEKKKKEAFTQKKIEEFKEAQKAKLEAAKNTQVRLAELQKIRVNELLSEQKNLLAQLSEGSLTAAERKERMKKLSSLAEEMKKLRIMVENRAAVTAPKPVKTPAQLQQEQHDMIKAASANALPRGSVSYKSAGSIAVDALKKKMLDKELNDIADSNMETSPTQSPTRTHATSVPANALMTTKRIYISGVSAPSDIQGLKELLQTYGPLAEDAVTARGKGIVVHFAMRESAAKALDAGITMHNKKLPMVWFVPDSQAPAVQFDNTHDAIQSDDVLM
eukprot:CFRG5422T1